MADKPKVYLGFLPKDEVFKFIERFKKALEEEKAKKTGDKKSFKFEIKGTKADPKGIAFETYSIEKTKFANFVDAKQDYMGKALTVFTISIGVNEESQVDKMKELYDKFSPMIGMIPWVAKKPGKYEWHFRSAGKKVFIDFISTEGEFLKPLLDLGIDISEYHNFNATLKSEFVPEDFFKLTAEEFILKGLQLLLSITGNSVNVKYLASATIKALKEVKLSNPKYQAKLEKAVSYLNFINAFVSSTFELEFDAKELSTNGISASKDFTGGMDVNEAIGGLKMMIVGAGKEMIKTQLEAQGLLETAKMINVDEITISATTPKYQCGVAHVIKLPGISKTFVENFLA